MAKKKPETKQERRPIPKFSRKLYRPRTRSSGKAKLTSPQQGKKKKRRPRANPKKFVRGLVAFYLDQELSDDAD